MTKITKVVSRVEDEVIYMENNFHLYSEEDVFLILEQIVGETADLADIAIAQEYA